MILSTKKRVQNKTDKKCARARTKLLDGRVDTMENRIKVASAVHNLLIRSHTQNSSYNRTNKMEKHNYVHKWKDTMVKRFVQYDDPLVFFESDEIPEDQRTLKKIIPPLPVPKPVQMTPRQPMPMIRPTNIPRATPITTTTEYNQSYRSKYVFSGLHKPVYDLLPSPAMFSLSISGINEGSKFLQETALEKIKYFLKTRVDANPPLPARKIPTTFKSCAVCEVDFSFSFFPIDSKRTKFLCDKCLRTKREQENLKIDVMALIANGSLVPSASPPPVTEIRPLVSGPLMTNLPTTCVRSPMTSTPNIHYTARPRMNPMPSIKIHHVRPNVDHYYSHAKLSDHNYAPSGVNTIPRLVVHQSNPMKMPDGSYKVNNVKTSTHHYMPPSVPVLGMPHGGMIRTQPANSVHLAHTIAHYNMGLNNMNKQPMNPNPASFRKDQRIPMMSTPILREKIPNNSHMIFSTRTVHNTPGLRLMNNAPENSHKSPTTKPTVMNQP